MQFSHKTQAVIQFIVPTAVTYFFAAIFLLNGSIPTLSNWGDASSRLALLSLVGVLFQDVIPKDLKETLVFWKLRNRLPGHTAFSDIRPRKLWPGKKTPPEWDRLRNASPSEQQSFFYGLYKSASADSSVSHYSQRYIAWRELSAFLIFLAAVTLPVFLTISNKRSIPSALILTGSCFIFYLLSVIAARSSARSVVRQTLIATLSKEDSIVRQ